MLLRVLLLIILVTGVSIWFDRSFPVTSAEQVDLAMRTSAEAGQAIPPKAFVFDGCTLFPDTIAGLSLSDSCLAHDIAYWTGGTAGEKKQADQLFKQSIKDQGLLGKMVGPVVYAGVVIFGDTWLTRQFDANWGFGWNK